MKLSVLALTEEQPAIKAVLENIIISKRGL